MSRHRNVRSMRYSDEYEGYDDVYGHSVEDDYTISPSDAAFMYDRNSRQPQMSCYLKGEEDIAEEDEQPSQEVSLDGQNKEKLAICLEEVKNILSDSYPDHILIKTIVEKRYDTAAAIDTLLNTTPYPKKEALDSPKPQRLNTHRSSEKGGSRNVRMAENSANLGNKTISKDKEFTYEYSKFMNANKRLMEKYERYKIDFSEVLIKFTPNIGCNDGRECNIQSVEKSSEKLTNNSSYKTISKRHHPLYTSRVSKIGYCLCSNYNIFVKKIAQFRKDEQTTIKLFKFDTPSPDEAGKKSSVMVKKCRN